jgi:manganese/zinc/iron transport system permease protein
LIVGIAAAALITGLRRLGNIDDGAAMGVVFTTLFALGLVLIRQAADSVDLDPDCVLYGALELAPLSTVSLAGIEVPRAVVLLGAILVVNAAFTVMFFKELTAISFDPELAMLQGLPVGRLHYALMVLVAATCVMAFESVGSILVIAMFVVPSACARLATHRLVPMMLIGCGVAVASAVGGHALAVLVPGAMGLPSWGTSGAIAVMSGLLLVVAIVASPGQGLVSRARRARRLRQRIDGEDALAHLLALEGAGDPDDLAHRPTAATYARLARGGLVAREQMTWRLSTAGRDAALELAQRHRDWEGYFQREVGVAPPQAHAAAEALEHVADPSLSADPSEKFPSKPV